MKGRGLLIAAAVIQLVGASFMLISGLSSLFVMSAVKGTLAANPSMNPQAEHTASAIMYGVGAFYLVMAGFTTWTSIALIQRKKWAWIVSLVMSCLSGSLMLLGIIGMAVAGGMSHSMMRGVGFGEAIILFIVGTPVYVVIGLLIGGRSAIGDAAAKGA